MVELQEPASVAPATIGGDEGASYPVAIRDLAACVAGDEAVPRRSWCLARALRSFELLALEAFAQIPNRDFENGLRVAARIPMAHEVANHLKLIAKRSTDRDVEREAAVRRRCGDTLRPR